MHPFIEALHKALPTTFSRQIVSQHLEGIYSVRTLANLDCLKKGPPYERIGRCVMYERGSFLDWLEGRFKEKNTEEGEMPRRKKKSDG